MWAVCGCGRRTVGDRLAYADAGRGSAASHDPSRRGPGIRLLFSPAASAGPRRDASAASVVVVLFTGARRRGAGGQAGGGRRRLARGRRLLRRCPRAVPDGDWTPRARRARGRVVLAGSNRCRCRSVRPGAARAPARALAGAARRLDRGCARALAGSRRVAGAAFRRDADAACSIAVAEPMGKRLIARAGHGADGAFASTDRTPPAGRDGARTT